MVKKIGQDFFTEPTKTVSKLPTGFYQLDNLLEGGLREGSIVEFFGPPGTGKTYMANILIAQAQQQRPDAYVAYLDYERAFDVDRAISMGVNMDRLRYAQPGDMESGYEGILSFLKSDEDYSLVFVDSVSAMASTYELENTMDKQRVADQARINTTALRRLIPTLGEKQTTLLLSNQIRDDIGGKGAATTRTSGGNAMRHFANTRLKFSRAKMDNEKVKTYHGKDEYREYGFYMRIKLEKHRGIYEGRTCELVYMFDRAGVDVEDDIQAYLFDKGILTATGAWYRIESVDGKFHGKKAVSEYIRNNREDIENLIKEKA